jgi:hypothetical protein
MAAPDLSYPAKRGQFIICELRARQNGTPARRRRITAGGNVLRDFLRWLTLPAMRRRQRPRSRSRRRRGGCLLWLLVLVIVLIVISLLFGGFRTGTKVGGAGAPAPVATAALVSR